MLNSCVSWPPQDNNLLPKTQGNTIKIANTRIYLLKTAFVFKYNPKLRKKRLFVYRLNNVLSFASFFFTWVAGIHGSKLGSIQHWYTSLPLGCVPPHQNKLLIIIIIIIIITYFHD